MCIALSVFNLSGIVVDLSRVVCLGTTCFETELGVVPTPFLELETNTSINEYARISLVEWK